MTLKEIFENKDFINFKKKELDESDKEYFLDRLRNGKGIYEVLPYLNVVKDAPIEFLEPIVEEAMEYEDISSPKRWMQTINRIYTPEKVQQTILNKITDSKDLRTKCRAVSILYCVRGFGIEYNWNGKRFEERVAKDNLNSNLERGKKFYDNRISILTNEFQKSKNIVYRYYLNRYLSDKIEDYPTEIKEKAKEVISIISSEKFPNGLNQVNQLVNVVKGNPELEKLLFEDLNWRKK